MIMMSATGSCWFKGLYILGTDFDDEFNEGLHCHIAPDDALGSKKLCLCLNVSINT